jgi:hypothetical protein
MHQVRQPRVMQRKAAARAAYRMRRVRYACTACAAGASV